MFCKHFSLVVLATFAAAHGDHEHQTPIEGPHKSLWYNTLPGDGGTQVSSSTSTLNKHPLYHLQHLTDLLFLGQADSVFSGISTFGRLPYFPCLASDAEKYDIAFIGK